VVSFGEAYRAAQLIASLLEMIGGGAEGGEQVTQE
jgi:hypothetical protein